MVHHIIKNKNQKGNMLMNIYSIPTPPPFPPAAELTMLLAEGGGARVERIVSAGQTSGWYDQHEAEYVILLQGEAVIEYDGGRRLTMARGDTVMIEPHERHRVCYTSATPPCIWLCVFLKP
jgi:cupin 2 domain-containing protein